MTQSTVLTDAWLTGTFGPIATRASARVATRTVDTDLIVLAFVSRPTFINV